MSKEEKKREQLKREVKIKEEENAVLDRQRQELQQHQEEMRKTYEANLARQQQEVMEQHQRDMEILQMNMRRESEEKERLMAEGFKQQADMMRDQVEATRKAMEEREQANKWRSRSMPLPGGAWRLLSGDQGNSRGRRHHSSTLALKVQGRDGKGSHLE